MTPDTEAGRRLLADIEADYGPQSPDAILAIETEALAGLTLDEGRLRAAHRNLFMASGQGMFGGYIDALIKEYARLAIPAPVAAVGSEK